MIRLCRVLGLLAYVVLFLFQPASSLNETVIDPAGNAIFDIPSPDNPSALAGLQGTLYFDVRLLQGLSLSMAPGQPGSFVVRWFEVNPGEIQFVVYSPTDVINSSLAVLRCQVDAPPAAPGGLESVIVSDLYWWAGLDGVLKANEDRYMNFEVRQEPGGSDLHLWIIK